MCFTRDSKGYIYKKNKLCISYGMLNIQGIYLVSINNIGKILKKIQKKLEKYSK
ncbi:hypothetical protein CBDKU1_02420 [Clostridium butyricum DKU-01]|nr:hypothetical protein CBDKU1_02420 [Clostridium butyricum DKU-01]